MATFKGPKDAPLAGRQPSMAQSSKDKMKSELGFESDGSGSPPESDSDDDKANTSASAGGGAGFDVQTVLTLQRSLRSLVNDKNELTDKLRAALDRAQEAEHRARSTAEQSNVKINMFTVAQKKELDTLHNTVDALRLSLQDVEKHGESEQGPRRLAETIQELTNEHRAAIEKAAASDAECKRLSDEMKSLETRISKQMEDIKAELTEARRSFDPVAAARFAREHNTIDNAELDALRQEAESLRSQLRDAQFNASHPAPAARGSVDSEQLREAVNKNRELTSQLKDLQAELARLKSMSASGSEKEQAQMAAHNELMAEMTALRTKSNKLENQVEDLQRRLREESEARKIAETETSDLKQSLTEQLKGSASAGEDAKARLQTVSQELASEKASHKAEASAHANTKKELETARGQLEKLKREAAELSSESANSLQKEKERATAAVQAAKADAAAKIAEIEQRSKDNMRDMKERLSSFAAQVQPMVQVVKFLSKNYRALSKQARDLQGEIAPTMKQYKRDLLKSLSEVDTQYKEMLVKYKKEMTLRKKLHNELVDMKGAIRVFCRVRPQIKEDSNGPEGKFVTRFDSSDDSLIIIRNKDKDATYELDKVFTPESKQEDVFEAARDLVVSVIDGYNVCIFAYGQTGSGKTFTMEGTDENPGLNRRSLRELFAVVEEKKGDWNFEIEISILEIYNETITDLLGEDRKAKLEVHQSSGKGGGNYVKGLSKHAVRSPEEVRAKFKESQKHRRVATTQMNDLSSRSHALLIVYVTGTNLSTGAQTRGKLNLIDLAGSERIAKSGAIDDDVRLKEAAAINTSLSALGTVINALASKAKHVPYRDSKLTYLLQDSLGGSAKTLMVVQVAPVLKNVGESVCSLNFAARVRAVELGGAKKQVESSEVAALKKRIAELEKGG